MPESPLSGIMIKMAESGNCEIETIERLVAMKREEEDRQAVRAVNAALSMLQTDMPVISKTGTASFKTKNGGIMSYNFDVLADICEAIKPLLFNSRLSYTWDQKQVDGMITVRCMLRHAQGGEISSVMSSAPDTSGQKNGIQQIASTISYLQRYTLKAVLGIASIDDDGKTSSEQAGEDKLKTDFVRWMATALINMRSMKTPEDLEGFYIKAVKYSSQYNTNFIKELEAEYTKIKETKGLK